MREEKIVLGGGIAGLVFAFYNQDYKIVSPDVGGQFNNYFDCGPRFLHDTPSARKFLKDLEIPVDTYMIGSGYYDKDWTNKNSRFREKYYLKSRGEMKGFNSKTTNNDESFIVLKVNFDDVISRLREKLKDNIIIDKAFEIIPEQNVLRCEKYNFKYKDLVSTIPRNVFSKLARENLDLKTIPVTFVLLRKDFFDMKDFDFVYFAGDTLYHRLTRGSDGIVAEIRGVKEKEDLENYFGDYYKDHFVLWNSQLISSDKPMPAYDNIKFFGRYGAWDNKWNTELAIEKAISFAGGKE